MSISSKELTRNLNDKEQAAPSQEKLQIGGTPAPPFKIRKNNTEKISPSEKKKATKPSPLPMPVGDKEKEPATIDVPQMARKSPASTGGAVQNSYKDWGQKNSRSERASTSPLYLGGEGQLILGEGGTHPEWRKFLNGQAGEKNL